MILQFIVNQFVDPNLCTSNISNKRAREFMSLLCADSQFKLFKFFIKKLYCFFTTRFVIVEEKIVIHIPITHIITLEIIFFLFERMRNWTIHMLKNHLCKDSRELWTYNYSIRFIIVHQLHLPIPFATECIILTAKWFLVYVLSTSSSPSYWMSIDAIETTLYIKLQEMCKFLFCTLISIIFIEFIDIIVSFITEERP